MTMPDMASGYVGILSVELHFPEVDHHELWQRARLTVACVAREHGEAEQLLEEAVRYLNGQEYELVSMEKEVVTTDD